MRIRQYAYFALVSESVSATEITSALGIEPDRIQVRGSRASQPPRPQLHRWEILSNGPGMSVDRHIAEIVRRLESAAAEIGALAHRLELVASEPLSGGSVLGVVRHLGDEDGDDEDAQVVELPRGLRLERIDGQHQLLGWFLDRTVVEFLHQTRACLDFDEYG